MVPSVHSEGSLGGLASHDVGNGGLAPQYGMEIVVYGGTARYGPWADRQRSVFSSLLFSPHVVSDVKKFISISVHLELNYSVYFSHRRTRTWNQPPPSRQGILAYTQL